VVGARKHGPLGEIEGLATSFAQTERTVRSHHHVAEDRRHRVVFGCAEVRSDKVVAGGRQKGDAGIGVVAVGVVVGGEPAVAKVLDARRSQAQQRGQRPSLRDVAQHPTDDVGALLEDGAVVGRTQVDAAADEGGPDVSGATEEAQAARITRPPIEWPTSARSVTGAGQAATTASRSEPSDSPLSAMCRPVL